MHVKGGELRLLLLSSSRVAGSRGWLDYCGDELARWLDGRRTLFVPWALADHDAYAALAARRLRELGCDLEPIHRTDGPIRQRVESAEAVFVGGGNTFRLLERARREGLLEPLREAVLGGLPYLGVSAGTNLACPSIRTTNDMPIVHPGPFDALGLVPFQINPHYVDPDPSSSHQGETRRERLEQYLEENETPVVALREGAWLRVAGAEIRLEGEPGAVLFRRGAEPRELEPGDRLDGPLPGGSAA